MADTPMQVQITHHYIANYGDHGGEAVHAKPYDPTETVEAMVMRVMGYPISQYRSTDPSEFVILRVVAGTEPKGAR